jgi:hypothetical protein
MDSKRVARHLRLRAREKPENQDAGKPEIFHG